MSSCRGKALVLVAWLVAGCSYPGEDETDVRKTAYQAYAAGLEAFNAKNWAVAQEKLSIAIEAGGLNPDVQIEAIIKRAVSRSALGEHDQATEELSKLESAGGPLDVIHAARSFVLKKQGKAAESRAALAKARQYNPKVQEFKD